MCNIIYKPDLSGTRYYDIKQYSKLCDFWELSKIREKRNNTKERNTPK